MRVCAVDPITGMEAVVVGAASASKDELSRLAVNKLEYLIAKKLGPDDPEPGQTPPRGTLA